MIDWVRVAKEVCHLEEYFCCSYTGHEYDYWDMLEPRETDIPALFLVFVVLPLVSYFLLGKWSETAKRKERISLIASGAVEEALPVDDMAVGSIMPVMHFPNSGIHQCARCFGPATTRCSQCKSVWYWYANFLTYVP